MKLHCSAGFSLPPSTKGQKCDGIEDVVEHFLLLSGSGFSNDNPSLLLLSVEDLSVSPPSKTSASVSCTSYAVVNLC